MTSPVVLAHVGHWWTSVLYVAPVGVVVGFLSFQAWKEKRREGIEE